MKLIIPQNIFATLFALSLDEKHRSIITPLDSSLIQGELEKHEEACALMPVCDLLKSPELTVSSNFGIAFDGLISNSYFYFDNNSAISELSLSGDVSSNEIVLSKILFSERYDSDLNFTIETEGKPAEGKNILIAGNQNFYEDYFQRGISFADEIAELLDYPFLNYVLVSKEEETLKKLHALFPSELDETAEENLSANLSEFGLSDNALEFIRMNWNSVYFSLLENEREGLQELIKQVYYHGVINDIFDIKFSG